MATMRDWLLRVLRVPTQPCIPDGARQVEVFRASPNYFRYQLALWILAQIGALIGLGFGLLFLAQLDFDSRYARLVVTGLEAIAWAVTWCFASTSR